MTAYIVLPVLNPTGNVWGKRICDFDLPERLTIGSRLVLVTNGVHHSYRIGDVVHFKKALAVVLGPVNKTKAEIESLGPQGWEVLDTNPLPPHH